MRRVWIGWAGLALLLGCGSDPAGPEASCIAVAMVAGQVYVFEGSTVPASAVSAAAFTEIVRNVGCNDTPEPGEVPDDVDEDGESNFLPAGTTLHAIDGVPPSSRLAFLSEGEWWVITAEYVLTGG